MARTGDGAARGAAELRPAGVDVCAERIGVMARWFAPDDTLFSANWNWESSVFSSAASEARAWLAAVDSSTMAAFFCVP